MSTCDASKSCKSEISESVPLRLTGHQFPSRASRQFPQRQCPRAHGPSVPGPPGSGLTWRSQAVMGPRDPPSCECVYLACSLSWERPILLVLLSLFTCVLRVAPAGSRPAAAALLPFSRVAARRRCAAPARPCRPQAGPAHFRSRRSVVSESLSFGSGPLPPRVLPASGSRPTGAERFQPGLGFLQPGSPRLSHAISESLPSGSRPAAATRPRSNPGRGPKPLRSSGPTSRLLWPGPARPEALHLASRVRQGPGLTPASTFAQGATALASRLRD